MKIALLVALFFIQPIGFTQAWFKVESGTIKKLNTIDFPSNEVGYIGGNDSLILKTINGGITWDPLDYTGVNFIETGSDDNILNLKFVDDLTGFMTVGPYSHGVYKTTNGGLNWTQITQSDDFLCYHYGLYLFNEDHGYLGGSGCFSGEKIQHIGESELTPRPISDLPLSSSMVVDIDFLDGNFGMAVSGFVGPGAIMRTIDGGLTWSFIETGLEDAYERLTSIAIINDTLAYIGYSADEPINGLMVTYDGGLTWDFDTETGSFFYPKFHALHKTNNGAIYSGGKVGWGYTGLIFEKKTDVDSWNTEPVDYPIYGLSSYADSVVWGVGDSGYIVVNHNPEHLSLPEINSSEPTSFLVYPNPAKATITLIIGNNELSEIDQINIYCPSGQCVYHNTKVTAEIDVNDLAPGIYIVSLTQKDGLQKFTKFTKQ